MYISDNDFYQALEYVERLKSRCLSESISFRKLLPENASIADINKFKEIFQKVKYYSSHIKDEADPGRRDKFKEKFKFYRDSYSKFIETYNIQNPNSDFDKLFPISKNDVENIPLNKNQAIVELFPMEDKIIVFIIKADTPLEQSSIICKLSRYLP